MILQGARVARGPRRAVRRDVRVAGEALSLDLAGHLLLPGLVNAHDHLEFNLFPRLGRGPYRNATEWARDIYHPERSPVREHLAVPKPVRLWWGALKNLLSGVTAVCHHNPYEPAVFGANFPVRVLRRFEWAHSLEFTADLAQRFRLTPPAQPFLVHCGEGTDRAARREIGVLDALGALDRRTVLIHGVGFTAEAVALMRRRGAALVWCPTSNLTTLGRTVRPAVLRSGLPVALGTDSALTAGVDLIDELAVARRYVDEDRLYEMVTRLPSRILRLAQAEARGDWIAVRAPDGPPARALMDAQITLVVTGGRIRLIDPTLARQLPARVRSRFQPLTVEGRAPVLVDADVRTLYRAAARHLGKDVHLAGKRILL